jgi:hypothetical protein
MKKGERKIKIVSCQDFMLWYKDQVGNVFPVISEEENIFWTYEPEGYKNIVYKKDAEVQGEELRSLDKALKDFRDVFEEAAKEWRETEEKVWNSLSKEQQLDVFCAVIRRLKEAEHDEQKSYRGVLYDKFGFDMDSYIRAQEAGFMEIHNSIKVKD